MRKNDKGRGRERARMIKKRKGGKRERRENEAKNSMLKMYKKIISVVNSSCYLDILRLLRLLLLFITV